MKTLALPVVFLSAFLLVRPIANGQSASSTPKAAQASPEVTLPEEPGEYAILYTSMGEIVCRLFPSEAPKAVANFAGLATGKKAWTDPATGKLTHRPLFSGTTFHRIIAGFMIQGGDPVGDGTGSPGYTFENETGSGRVFDKAGLLAMANSGTDTNGSQFFITVAPAEHLNGKYTIFGEVVSGQDVVDAISKVPTNEEDRPLTPVKLVKVAIKMVAAPKAGGTAKH